MVMKALRVAMCTVFLSQLCACALYEVEETTPVVLYSYHRQQCLPLLEVRTEQFAAGNLLDLK